MGAHFGPMRLSEAASGDFRKLETPFFVRPMTERSQAIQGAMVFGVIARGTLSQMGVGDAMLALLVSECILEEHKGSHSRYYRLHPALALVSAEDLGGILYPEEK